MPPGHYSYGKEKGKSAAKQGQTRHNTWERNERVHSSRHHERGGYYTGGKPDDTSDRNWSYAEQHERKDQSRPQVNWSYGYKDKGPRYDQSDQDNDVHIFDRPYDNDGKSDSGSHYDHNKGWYSKSPISNHGWTEDDSHTGWEDWESVSAKEITNLSSSSDSFPLS